MMNFLLRLRRSPVVAVLVISSLSFLFTIGLRRMGALEYLELAVYDVFMRLRPGIPGVDPRIVLVEISEKDILQQGRWPVTDRTVSKTLKILTRFKPRAIGLDIFRDIPVPPGTKMLNATLRGNDRIIGVMKFGDGGIPPPAVLKGTAQVGFNDIIIDPDGIVRRGLLFLDNGDTVSYSFDLLLALRYLQTEGIIARPDKYNPQFLLLGKSTIRPFEADDGGYVRADAKGYQYLLDFRQNGKSFSSYSLRDVLSGEIPSKAVRDKIVLVGVSAQSVKDFFHAPYSRGLREKNQVPGIVLHAHMVSQLLRLGFGESTPIQTTTERQELIWILLWSLLGGLMGFRVRSPWLFSVLGTAGLLVLWAATYLAFLDHWWMPSVSPAMTWLISAAVVTAYISNQERKQRTILMHLFSKHVSPEVAESIWAQRDQFLQGARPRSKKMMVTVLFSDLKNFTSLSESMDPQPLIDWLNTYMESMADLVMEYGGVVDDYAGDGIKANFGVPVPRKTTAEISQDALGAVACALAMEERMKQLNEFWRKKGLPMGGMRIGIFTGPVVAGAVGSSQRLKYTTVGDTVNIAARLESYDKELARDSTCRILVGEETVKYLGDRFRTQLIGEANLKGKYEKITIYRVISGNGEESTKNLRGQEDENNH
jgi:adenylate cyclase